MPYELVSGDPLLTRAAVLAVGHNARGRTENTPLAMRLMRAYPAAFSTYQRRARQGRQPAGDLYLWSQSNPSLLFVTVRNSSVSATRLRHVQQVFVQIARDHRLYNLSSLAIAPLGRPQEQRDILRMAAPWLRNIKIPVLIYTDDQPDIIAAETLLPDV